MDVLEFRGPFRFLSNFWFTPVTLDGETYPTVEHAYQAAKTLSIVRRRAIQEAPQPGDAKRQGRTVPLRPGWDAMRLDVMCDLLEQKFAREPLRSLLLATGEVLLIEGNHWGDTFWGVCRGMGENHLGRLLMAAREEIRARDVM